MFVNVALKRLCVLLDANSARINYLLQCRRFVHDVPKILDIKPYTPPQIVDFNDQSVLLPGPERIRASRLSDNPTAFTEEIPGSPHIKTVYDCLDHGLKLSNDGDCLGARPPGASKYEWIKYSEVCLRTLHLGSALVNLGLKQSDNSMVGVFATNRIEFCLMLYACAGYSIVLVPIYDSAGPESVNFIINQKNTKYNVPCETIPFDAITVCGIVLTYVGTRMYANLSVLVANSNKNAKLVLQEANKFPLLKTMVIMDSPTRETRTLAEDAKVQLLTFSEFEALGKSDVKELSLPKPEDLFCIPYTSGTTGFPKGVMLTHRNITACLSSLVFGYGPAGVYGGTIISFLPPAHLYEIMNQIASIYFARRIAFYAGDVKKLLDEVRILKPNILPLVPRLMNAVYTKVLDEAKTKKWKYTLFQYALSRKEKMLKKGIITNKSIWDKLVFKKVQEALGGNLDIVVTTSAPVSVDVMRFFKCVSGCYVFEAYGQTEAMAATFSLPRECLGDGSVGPPLPCSHVKLADVPEMNYWAKNDEGEVCCKGSSVSKGYFKLQEATAELISSDGWLHSGDIGKWLPNGALKIIDRKKHIFKLSQGEYIAPEKIEIVYSRCPLVMQLYIDGFEDQNYIIALVVPNPDAFLPWVKAKGFAVEKDKLLQDRGVRLAFLQKLQKLGKERNLNSLEQARDLILIDEPFSTANGLLTPTLKLKRNLARKQFESLLRATYKEGPLSPSISACV